MRSAAQWLAVFALAMSSGRGQAPSRPTVQMPEPPLSVSRIGRVDYVSLSDAAARLGMTASVSGSDATLTLKDGQRPVAHFQDGSREAQVLGYQVFLGDIVIARDSLARISKIDLERCIEPMLRPARLGTPPRPPKTIAIDAGHGGIDKGTTNERFHVFEKTYTLDTAKRLEPILRQRGYAVVMTRIDDHKVELADRPAIAARAGADLFVSIHFNSVPSLAAKTSGIEVFRYTPQHQVPIRRAPSQYMPVFDSVLDPGNANDRWNTLLAFAAQRTVLREMASVDRGLRDDRLAVLRLAQCPACLVEGGFLSNDAEAQRIMTADYRQRLAVAIADSIDLYARELESLRRLYPH